MQKKYLIPLLIFPLLVIPLAILFFKKSSPVEPVFIPNSADYSIHETSADELYALRKYAHDHPDDTALADYLADYDRRLSIHDILPLSYLNPSTGESYYIFFETSLPTCERLYCIKIGASTQSALDAALADLRSRGYNPSDYELITSVDR